MKKDDRIKETAQVITRLEVLRTVQNYCVSYDVEGITLGEMIGEYQARLDYLDSTKEYMIHFESGGWNTTWAIDEEAALLKAKEEYPTKSGEGSCVVKRVSLATPKGIEAALRMFY